MTARTGAEGKPAPPHVSELGAENETTPMMQSPVQQQPQVIVKQDPDLLNQLEEEKKQKDRIRDELKANEEALVNE